MAQRCLGGGSRTPALPAGAAGEGVGGGQRAAEAGGGGGELLLTAFRERSSRPAGLRLGAPAWALASGPGGARRGNNAERG